MVKKWLKKDSTLCVKNNVACVMNGGDSYIYINRNPLMAVPDGEYDAELYKKLGKWERIGEGYIPEFKEEKLVTVFSADIIKKALSFTNIKKFNSYKTADNSSFVLAFTEKSVRSTNFNIAYLSDFDDVANAPTMLVDGRSFPSHFESVELYETYVKVNVKDNAIDYYIPATVLNDRTVGYMDFTKIVDLKEQIDIKLDISKVRYDFDYYAKEAKIEDKRNKEKPYRFALDSEHGYDVRYLDIFQKAGFTELYISREHQNDMSFIGKEIALIARRND
jgi:hypothetical protein